MEGHGGWHQWSPEQWVLLIGGALSALGAFVTAIIHAIKSSAGRQDVRERLCQLEQQIQAHEQRAQARTAKLLHEDPSAPFDPRRRPPLP